MAEKELFNTVEITKNNTVGDAKEVDAGKLEIGVAYLTIGDKDESGKVVQYYVPGVNGYNDSLTQEEAKAYGDDELYGAVISGPTSVEGSHTIPAISDEGLALMLDAEVNEVAGGISWGKNTIPQPKSSTVTMKTSDDHVIIEGYPKVTFKNPATSKNLAGGGINIDNKEISYTAESVEALGFNAIKFRRTFKAEDIKGQAMYRAFIHNFRYEEEKEMEAGTRAARLANLGTTSGQ